MKPGLSFARTGVLPSFVPNATTSSYTASSVAMVRTTSTSLITGTGLKKCKPTNRIQGGKQFSLCRQLLDDRFHNQVGVLQVFEGSRSVQSSPRFAPRSFGNRALLDQPV